MYREKKNTNIYTSHKFLFVVYAISTILDHGPTPINFEERQTEVLNICKYILIVRVCFYCDVCDGCLPYVGAMKFRITLVVVHQFSSEHGKTDWETRIANELSGCDLQVWRRTQNWIHWKWKSCREVGELRAERAFSRSLGWALRLLKLVELREENWTIK